MMVKDLDQTARPRRRGWHTSAAMLSAAAMVAGIGVVAGTPASYGAARLTPNATSSFKACEVTDTGGINDRSFNASAYAGLKVAAAAIPGLTYGYLGSTSTSDYTYSPTMSNVLGLFYETNEDAFMGGYLAAAMSKTDIVGTFGGQNIPPVTIYMDGFVAGVRYYDKLNHGHVTVLGWVPTANRPKGSLAGNGVFTNDFTNQALGKTDTQTLIAQGADIIFPVAGAVGLGAAAAVKAAGAGHYMEWVDTDGCISAPQYCSLFLTSVTKGIVASVSSAVEQAAKGTFKGGNYTGDLANDGVSLAPYHDFASKIPMSVQSELLKIKAGIIAGKISVDPNSYPLG
ncbi:MAG: BMP family ABC transporter substrate-binding protein [Acidimicrobiales bacterium]